MKEAFENKIKQCEQQKKEIDSFRPLDSEQSKLLKEHFKIGLTYSSNALEGNTLTLIETKVIIEDRLTIGGKSLTEINEATGHAKAYDLMFELVEKENVDVDDVLKIHKLFYEQIDPKSAGNYRNKAVFISGMDTKLPAPEKVEKLMQEFGKDLVKLKEKLHPIEYAATIHNRLVTIHPFSMVMEERPDF